MSYKIRNSELEQITERIANECASWEDVVWVITDYLPLSVLDAVCDWDEVNSSDMTIENLEGLESGYIVEDRWEVEWEKRVDGLFEVYYDPTDDTVLQVTRLSANAIYLRGPVRVVGH